jgi:hypothetical protein
MADNRGRRAIDYQAIADALVAEAERVERARRPKEPARS